MKTKSIRRRVALALLIWSGFSALAFAVASYLAADNMELLVLEQNLAATATRVKQAVEQNEVPHYPAEEWYWGGPESKLDLPKNVQQLTVGSHHDVMIEGREFHVWVDKLPHDRLFLLYDLSEIERYEDHLVTFLVGCVFLLAIMGFITGSFGTAWVVRPLEDLAHRLQQLPPGARRFDAPQENDQDLVPMVSAIDELLRRNAALVERESRFTRIASHELRNPLASLSAALDLIQSQNKAPTTAAPLQRAQRATQRMSDMVAALLSFSRQEASANHEPAECCAAEVIREHIAELNEQSAVVATALCDLDDSVILAISPPLFAIVAGNLVRNALQHGSGQIVRVQLETDALTVSNQFEVTSPNTDMTADRLGLGIVELICGYQGWRLEHTVHDEQYIARVLFKQS
ncbi:MAG: sensor histidine kinase [Oceanococcus sp.]